MESEIEAKIGYDNSIQPELKGFALSDSAQPFLRWAGGKRWLLPHLRFHSPANYLRYLEPFLGSGAVLLSIPTGKYREASDINAELVNCFTVVRDEPSKLWSELLNFRYGLEDYLAARERFNVLKAQKDGARIERAALFIYLNKTSFNGIYRENLAGGFNVPWGKITRPPLNLEDNLRAASTHLRGGSGQSKGSPAKLREGGYQSLLGEASSEDWVYLDPPYVPLSKTSAFVSYTSNGFGPDHQLELRELAEQASMRGAKLLVSNSDTPEVRALYSGPPWKFVEVSAGRSIGASGVTRKKVGELLIKNYD